MTRRSLSPNIRQAQAAVNSYRETLRTTTACVPSKARPLLPPRGARVKLALMRFVDQCGRCRARSSSSRPPWGAASTASGTTSRRSWPRLARVHRGQPRALRAARAPARAQGGACAAAAARTRCRLAEGERGYCGARRREGAGSSGGTRPGPTASFYFDPLPTNCVAEWVCGATGATATPPSATSPGPEYGWRNLAVFYQSCSFNCLFCQNWHFKEEARRAKLTRARPSWPPRCVTIRPASASSAATPPRSSPMPWSARGWPARRGPGRILRICFETAGRSSRKLLRQMADVAAGERGLRQVRPQGLERERCTGP